MLSEKQIKEINNRIRITIDFFITHDVTLKELSCILNIPFSTIQRDLNDINRIKEIYAGESEEVLALIREKLIKNKNQGLSNGGKTSSLTNEVLRDDNGKFTGNIKK